jgi:hypothetical protein
MLLLGMLRMKIGIVDIDTFYYFMDCGTFNSMEFETQDEFYQFMMDEWYYRLRIRHEMANMNSVEEE